MNAPQTLRDLVVAAKDSRATSARQLAFAAQRHGFKVVDTTLNAIAAGTYKSKPSHDTIRAIAWLADVSDEVAFAAAGVPMPGPPFAEELPPGVDDLSQPSRKAAVEILRALVRAEKAGESGGDTAATKTGPDGPAPSNVTPLKSTETGADESKWAARPSEGNPPANAPDTTTGEGDQSPSGDWEPR